MASPTCFRGVGDYEVTFASPFFDISFSSPQQKIPSVAPQPEHPFSLPNEPSNQGPMVEVEVPILNSSNEEGSNVNRSHRNFNGGP